MFRRRADCPDVSSLKKRQSSGRTESFGVCGHGPWSKNSLTLRRPLQLPTPLYLPSLKVSLFLFPTLPRGLDTSRDWGCRVRAEMQTISLPALRRQLSEPVEPSAQFGNGAYIRYLRGRLDFATRAAVAALEVVEIVQAPRSPASLLFDIPAPEQTGSKPSGGGETVSSREPTVGNRAHTPVFSGSTPGPATNS